MKQITSILTVIALTVAVLLIAGCTQQSGDSALAADYYQKLGKSQQSLANLTAAYEARSGVMMSQPEFKAWLELDRNLTTELLTTSNETLDAGQVYLRTLKPDSQEYSTVTGNEATLRANIDVAKEKYNTAVDNYNKWWGGPDSEFVHL
ncbi:hypothetical protein [Methanocella sp. MCL-LM]|uniref:hypothetical protein n=1 Tax=Methanocella sp. MCL-LM TaxID=3412035 RepID=UPI003C70C6FC